MPIPDLICLRLQFFLEAGGSEIYLSTLSMKAPLIALVLAASTALSSAQDPPDDLNSLKSSYEKARQEAVQPIKTRYVDSLHTMKLKYSQAGNLENALAVEDEIKTVSADQPATSGGVKPAPPEDLAVLQQIYQISTSRATDPLARKYIEALEAMKLKYTQMNKLDLAVEVDREIKAQRAALPVKNTTATQSVDIAKLTGTRWRLPRHVLPETPDNDKWVRFAADGVLECGWGPKTMIWRLNESGTVNFRPFKNQNRLLVFKWDNVSNTAIITDDGKDHEVSQKKGG